VPSFLDSTTAYQGFARGLSPERIVDLNAIATNGLIPDRTIVLDIDPVVGIERATELGADRLEGESRAFHEAVRRGFLAIAALEPGRVRVVDAAGSPDEVADAVARALADMPVLAGALS
jgi:dTMP kinase